MHTHPPAEEARRTLARALDVHFNSPEAAACWLRRVLPLAPQAPANVAQLPAPLVGQALAALGEATRDGSARPFLVELEEPEGGWN